MATLLEQIENKKKFIKKKENIIEKKYSLIAKKQKLIDDTKNTLMPNERKWLQHDIDWLNDDILHAKKDIEDAQKRLEELNTKQKIEDEKNANRNIKPILEFLERYRLSVIEYYRPGIASHYEAKTNFHNLVREYETKLNNDEDYMYNDYEKDIRRARETIVYPVDGYWKSEPNPIWKEGCSFRISKTVEYFISGTATYADKWYKSFRTYDDAMSNLEKYLDKDCKSKYDKLVDEVMIYTGKITDASYLNVGEKGDLTGYIIGELGKAKVETIGAGGYNIQCFHYRTLIKPVNN